MIGRLFGNELEFLCMEYLNTFKQEPTSFKKLFKFMVYRNVKNTLSALASASNGGK